MTDDDQAQPAPRSFLKGRLGQGSFGDRFKRIILHPEMTPEQVALSFAIGFAVAWNPFVGLHTWLILLLCIIFRKLHRPLMLLTCYLNNPWTMLPIASVSSLVGNLLLGRGWHLNFHNVKWHTIGWRSFVTRHGFDGMCHMLKPILVPYLLGGLVLCALALPVGYYLMLRIARRLRHLHIHLPPAKLPPLRAKPRADDPE
jgi:uncharacterized protein (DUF2062 family)